MGSSPLQRRTHHDEYSNPWRIIVVVVVVVVECCCFIIICYCWQDLTTSIAFGLSQMLLRPNAHFSYKLAFCRDKTMTCQMRPFVVGSVFGQHSHTWVPSINLMLEVIINEKSVFVDPSHTFCLTTYDASDGFEVFSNNTHTLCGVLKIVCWGW